MSSSDQHDVSITTTDFETLTGLEQVLRSNLEQVAQRHIRGLYSKITSAAKAQQTASISYVTKELDHIRDQRAKLGDIATEIKSWGQEVPDGQPLVFVIASPSTASALMSPSLLHYFGSEQLSGSIWFTGSAT